MAKMTLRKRQRVIVVALAILACQACLLNGFQFHRGRKSVQKNSILPTSLNPIVSSSVDAVLNLQGSEAARFPTIRNDIASLDRNQTTVPRNMFEATKTFLFTGDHGPLYVIMAVVGFTSWRLQLSTLEFTDCMIFGATILFWSFQEHFLHERVLHSRADWLGKDIHQVHHDKPYYHVSIDPAPLLVGWMLTAHFVLRAMLPLPLALTATVAYSMSGLFYEWAHYIVHTKVRFRSKFWKRVKENHLRHHVVSDKYWYAFSMPFMDDIFGTNPCVRQVQLQKEEQKLIDR